MRHRFFTTAITLLLLATQVRAEEISYALFALEKSGKRIALSEGKRTYSQADVESTSIGQGDKKYYHKQLTINNEFSVGASIFPRTDADGFGLWMKKRPAWYEIWSTGGFSWEWFDRDSGSHYTKRQGPGLVKAVFIVRGSKSELASVEFLQDVTFRLSENPWFFFASSETHHMLIKAGSVLRVAP